MVYISPNALPPGAVRILAFGCALIWVPGGAALAINAPFGRFTAVGVLVALCGLLALRMWWTTRTSLSRPARRLQTRGALLRSVPPYSATSP